ncbi:hypothetical protein ACJMK2_031501 [Sinanodonta woodiana]|uniref:Uncharacterized protein n=1 Tax=Sinanodonta woodiana TaxID=1069815 RepID=A0ABD3WZI5_SINWO
MARSFVFLQYMLMILLAKYVPSSTNCICKLEKDQDFCKPNITAVQGKVLGSQLANANGDLVSDISMAQKTRYRVELLHTLINGSHELHLVNNTFKIPVPLGAPCNFNFTKGSSYIFVGDVNGNGRWSKLNCYLNIGSRGQGKGSGRGFGLGDGDDSNFFEFCSDTDT